MKNIKVIYTVLGALVSGLLLGWLLFSDPTKPLATKASEHTHAVGEFWTCAMHPQVRQDGPGSCPFCGMDLVPSTTVVASSPAAVQLSLAAVQVANVQTVIVQEQSPTREVHLSGKVTVDERETSEITARFGGRIDRLLVEIAGQQVRKRQPLASIYSPDLVVAQHELIEATRLRDSHPSLYEAAVNKLKLWGLSASQIAQTLKNEKPDQHLTIFAPHDGTITARHVSTGDYVQEGQSLFSVANLDRLWVSFDAYESDLPWIQVGDEIHFTVNSLPGKLFSGTITFIDPFIDPSKQAADVRVEVSNAQRVLKPAMNVRGTILSDRRNTEKVLTIPKSAVLWTGRQSVVYVQQPNTNTPSFVYREVTLGSEYNDYYAVLDGLEAGEEVVANGTFKIDAAAQLQGANSMMAPPSDTRASPTISSALNLEFQQELGVVFSSYLRIKEALVNSAPQQARAAAAQTRHALDSVFARPSEGESQWATYRAAMQAALTTIAEQSSLDEQRAAFAPLSTALYHSLQQFGTAQRPVFYQHCPMGEQNQGAYWLSDHAEIRNPYFGEAMLTCGSVAAQIK